MNTAPSDNNIHALIAALLINVEDPDALEWYEVIASADWDKWMEGTQSELQQLAGHGSISTCPPSQHTSQSLCAAQKVHMLSET